MKRIFYYKLQILFILKNRITTVFKILIKVRSLNGFFFGKDLVTRLFLEKGTNFFLKGVKVSFMQEAIDLFVYALKHKTKSSAGEKQKAIKEIQQEIDKNTARIKEAQLMRLDKEIEMIEYLEVKKAYEPVVKRLIQQQAEISQLDENLSKYAEEGGDFLKQFPEFFKNLDPKGQQLFLGSMLAEKLVFENNDYRTIKMVKVIERIATINKDLQENKNGTSQFFIEKSHQVARTRFELVSPP